jgi:hypothetical protein
MIGNNILPCSMIGRVLWLSRLETSSLAGSIVGLVPLNPARVLNDLPKPRVEDIVQHTANMPIDFPSDVLRTPVTRESLMRL